MKGRKLVDGRGEGPGRRRFNEAGPVKGRKLTRYLLTAAMFGLASMRPAL